MLPDNDINRFIEAQNESHWGWETALKEITDGKKTSHWIWFIFPQIRGLGYSYNSNYYGISDKTEAEAYLNHPVLGSRLREITKALLEHKDKDPNSILGSIDAQKVRSCMTLFDTLSPNDIFAQALDAFYGGKRCGRTLRMLNK